MALNRAYGSSTGGVTVLTMFKTTFSSVTNDAVLTLDNELQTQVLSSTHYLLYGQIRYDSDAVPDIKLHWQMPSGAAMVWNTDFDPLAEELTQATTLVLATANTSIRVAVFHGVVLTGTVAGTFGLEWAQNTANAARTGVRPFSGLTMTQLS